jgi:CheY-like chemotaxis protein
MSSLALVVENDESTRRLVDVVLTRHGYEVDAVGNGADALLLLGSIDYDLIVLDLMLPGASGADILSWLRNTRPVAAGRALVLSSAPKQQLEFVRDEFPEVRLLRKPFELHELIDAAAAARRDRADVTFTAAEYFERRSIVAGAKAGVLVRSDGPELSLVHKFGYAANVAERWFPIPSSASLPLCQCVREARPRWLNSLTRAASEFPHLESVWQELHSQAVATVPLMRDGVVLGAAGWSFREPHSFDEREQRAFTAIADDAAASLDSMQTGEHASA